MKKLLVLSASIGAGHVSAAEALCQAYREQYGGEVRHIDFLRYVSPRLSTLVEQAYYLMTKRVPFLYKFIYQLEDRPPALSQKLDGFIGASKYIDLIQEFQPDAIISTHFLPAAVVSYMYKRFPILNGVVLTDYVPHRLWIYPHNQLLFVAHAQMKETLQRLGVNPVRVKVTGIPVHSTFQQKFDQRAIREKLQLPVDQPLLLLMSGGNANGPLMQVLASLRPLRDQVQVVTITGKNRQAYEDIQFGLEKLQLPWRVLGFVDNMHEWMAAADLLISKPGGLTVTETLISGLPMLIIRPTPGQEDGNTEFLVNSGAGIYLERVEEVSSLLGELLAHPDRLAAMSEKAKSLAQPDAAGRILQEIVLMLLEKEVGAPDKKGEIRSFLHRN